ncbi:hypothetical protein K492DRAFT_236609 [Lichtheimia hyalospora FSU 10163]|nr:hypothetical protein K492DRAFT_236609 [Lichtheimia hyalospora FSU 10163]
METGNNNNTGSDAQANDSTSAIPSPNAADTITTPTAKPNNNAQTKPTQPATLNVPAGKPSASTTTTASSVANDAAAAVSTADVRATPISHTPHPITQDSSVAVEETALQKQKLVEEFQYLLEKSQSLFSGLRDLPPTGSHRQWRPYFEKTFEVYTKLWKFQQTHRPVLEDKSNYGLKRWEVGEIASKIGQLYYHYYLRTSDTSYLQEAYVFYDAIHERQYFRDILEVKNPALMIKKMRYYARFIVVSLLLNREEKIRMLVSELENLVDEYTKNFKPPDAKEWQVVLQEISTFMEAEKKPAPISVDRLPVTVMHRLSPTMKIDRDSIPGTRLKLQEAILVGNSQKQIKFSELTLDMYRMLQSLEMEPTGNFPSATPKTTSKAGDQGGGGGGSTLDGAKDATVSKEESTTAAATTTTTSTSMKNTSAATSTPPTMQSGGVTVNTNALTQPTTTDKPSSRRINPHKYLLYRPSLSQLFVYIATAFKDTAENGVMLLYLSADGCEYPDVRDTGYKGGVAANQRKTQPPTAVMATPTSNAEKSETTPTTSTATANTTAATGTNVPSSSVTASASSPTHVPSTHCLHPADLVPFTRKPLFLIVDSSNSIAFNDILNVFGQPLLILMSPVEYPSSVQDRSEIGSLFTLFLHTPLLGFCLVSDIGDLDTNWDECVTLITDMEQKTSELLLENPEVDPQMKRFMADEFLWTFIVRFTLCCIILRCHSSFKDEKTYPTSSPALPDSIYNAEEIITMLHRLTSVAKVGTYFNLPFATDDTAEP